MRVKVNSAGRARSRLFGVLIAIGMIVLVCILTTISASETKKTISVVRLKDSVSANAMITDDMIEEYEMYYKEFEQYGVFTFSDGAKKKSIITWEDRDNVVGKRFAAYYLRGGTVLFWDSLMKEQTKKNSYLYSMDGELLNIQMDTADFGDMVVPGDTLNIRARYTKVSYDLPTEEEYKLAFSNNADIVGVEETVTEMLFSEVTVLDMLNSDGNSIFDIYYDYISKSKAQQSALLKDDTFLSSVKPKTILLEVTAEEADRFMEIGANDAEFLMTLLPRTGSNSIIDSLAEIQSALNGTSKSDK
jgi:hypothetical protein